MATLKIAWNWRERLARGERGAELIEFALVLPLLLLLVLGIVDFGFMFQRLEVVTNAAREGGPDCSAGWLFHSRRTRSGEQLPSSRRRSHRCRDEPRDQRQPSNSYRWRFPGVRQSPRNRCRLTTLTRTCF